MRCSESCGPVSCSRWAVGKFWGHPGSLCLDPYLSTFYDLKVFLQLLLSL